MTVCSYSPFSLWFTAELERDECIPVLCDRRPWVFFTLVRCIILDYGLGYYSGPLKQKIKDLTKMSYSLKWIIAIEHWTKT